MQVVHDYFENGITFSTDLIYTFVRFSIGSGEVAPFVGHGAFFALGCDSVCCHGESWRGMKSSGPTAMSLRTLTSRRVFRFHEMW